MAAGFLQPDQINDIGFLRRDQRNDIESVGNNIFNVLLQNSLLQVAERDEYGNVSSCEMHDMVHDMARSVFGISPVRYRILEEESSNILEEESSTITKEAPKLLRILVVNGKIPSDMFSDFECLHVLILKGYGVKEVPNTIRKLIHLRNLNVSKTRIENLPDWIGELHHLQTLRADRVGLRKLPSTLKYLINLRNLYIREGVELPAEIGRLTCLQTLRYFTVGHNKGHQIEELGSLKNLKGKLKIRNLEKVRGKQEAEKAKIFQKPNLFDLEFEWGDSGEGERNDESVLEGLQPHRNLKKLGIRGFKGKRFGSFGSWSEKMAVRDGPQGSWVPLNNLIEITLSECPECEEIPTLQHLPNLKSLYLNRLKKVRFINSSFNNLMSLRIKGLEKLECLPYWLFDNNQNLSKLEIQRCPKLIELPNGLQTLNCLEELMIWDCENVKSIGNPIGGQQSQGLLRELWIGNCGGLMELPRQMVESWVGASLERLVLIGLSSLKNLPMLIDCLPESARLRNLTIVGVPKLMGTRSVESWGLGSLRRLNIDVSKEWSRETMDAILRGCSNSLTSFKLKGVENWEWVPESIQHLTSLEELELENLGVEEVPQWLGNLSSLQDLSLISCNKLRRLPSRDALVRLTELQYLDISDCPKLQIDLNWRINPNITISVDHHPLD